MLYNSLKLATAHFQTIQPAKSHCTMDMSKPKKTRSHSYVWDGQTSHHNISTEHVHVPFAWLQRKQSC